MSRIFAVSALVAGLATAGCVNPDGSTNWGQTLALGAGVGLGTALIAGAAADDGGRHRHYGHSYGRSHGSVYASPRYATYGPPRGYYAHPRAGYYGPPRGYYAHPRSGYYGPPRRHYY